MGENEKKERHYLPNKDRVRHLKQYNEMTDEEFNAVWSQKVMDAEPSKVLEERIENKMEEFAEDYDLDDLKINDKLTLRALIQSILSLEDYEQLVYRLRSNGVSGDNIVLLEKLGKEMTNLRGDITSAQNDLKITRKIRKSDQETSVLNYIEVMRAKAREYYESKMLYILCPKCRMLLSTVWYLYPTENNKMELTCHRTLDDGTLCGEKIVVHSKDLLENKGSNKPEILPESLL